MNETIDPERTIGSVSRIHFFDAIPVRGIGIVAGLHGTGSSECPPMVRENLEKYIWKQIPVNNAINARAFIESTNTAVVEVFGVIPALSSDRDSFDVAVRPLSSSQTTSLDGGHLYTTELKELSRLARLEQFSMFSKTLATVEGPVYSNKLVSSVEESHIWYVLGGAKPIQSTKTRLILDRPDFLTAYAIRNRINERFKSKTAVPLSDAEIILQIPSNYLDQKERFLEMVKSLQLGDNPALKQNRIKELTQQLLNQPENETFEIALEAIGRPALDSLALLLEHPDESVRFHAARCMLNIGDNRAIKPLREMLLDPTSLFRLRTVEVIGRNATRTDARAILTLTLSDVDIQIRLAAYEMLLRMNSSAISRKIVAGDFVVDSVICPGPKIIYVYQEKTPRIVLFGAPVYCNNNIFIQSDDGIIINAKPGDKFISVSRRHPQRPRVIGPLSTGFEVSSLIQTLGELSETKNSAAVLPGLAVSYAKILPILEKMCENNAIPAVFIAGPPITVDPVLQNLPPISR
ncbi:MAG: flagellar basal body P-ring protein FlgI [Phycisphaerae bacterium]|nr:flagellar basal body P-ring protein FlgI [Phycisphaerae bacterium]